MNSILNSASDPASVLSRNRASFAERFPELASILGLDTIEGTRALAERIPPGYALCDTPAGVPTLSSGGVFLHSRYNPLREAERAFAESEAFGPNGCLFAGCALAYLPELYAAAFPAAPLWIVEPDIFLFLLALAARPLDALLAHPNLVLMIGTPAREVTLLMEKLDLAELPVYEAPNLIAPNRPWFAEFDALRERGREKREINANTLRRFGDLWLRNMCRNLDRMRDLAGIDRFAALFPDMPVLVLAAGPSLDRILPDLPSLSRTCVVIAVDTAARACVRSGVQPDFIVLVDPQYWNWRHLDGLECPSSILITESAAWPAVFRFSCRAIYLCSSLFPLGRFLEERTFKKGELGAGGSVSTTAWDFACHLGSARVFMAGLDLGFPRKQTHFTGSIFEERAHTASQRLSPAETAGYQALYGAGPYPVSDYLGGTVLTDRRLILYAWWFESRVASRPGIRTATITPEGVKIPGFGTATVGELLEYPDCRAEIDERLSRAVAGESGDTDAEANASAFDRALRELLDALDEIRALAGRGVALCEKRGPDALAELARIDRAILSSRAKEITAMVFDAAKAKAAAGQNTTGNGELTDEDRVFAASAAMYRTIQDAAGKNIRLIGKFH